MSEEVKAKTPRKIEIKVKPEIVWVELDKLIDVQGSLKFLTTEALEKFLNSMEKHGFLEPFGLWENKKGELIILGGNQRRKVLKKAASLGWDIPKKYPAFKIVADTLQEANEKLLSMASSFGKIDQDRLEHFIAEHELVIEEIKATVHYPEIGGVLHVPDKRIYKEFEKDVGEGDKQSEDEIMVMKLGFLTSEFKDAVDLLNSVYEKMKEKGVEIDSQAGAVLEALKFWDKENK